MSFWRSHSLHRIVFCADEIFLIRVLIDQKSIIHTFIFVRNVWFVWYDDFGNVMMFQVFKSAVGHSIFGGSVIIHWQAQWIWTWKKIAMSDSQAFCVCFLLSLFFKYHERWIFGRRKPLIVHIFIYIKNANICLHKHRQTFREKFTL